MAERLRVEDGAAFQVLSETQIIFRYHDEDTDYQMLAPLIGLHRDGAVWEIRFNAAIMTIAECCGRHTGNSSGPIAASWP